MQHVEQHVGGLLGQALAEYDVHGHELVSPPDADSAEARSGSSA
jgi:hypothetical protein